MVERDLIDSACPCVRAVEVLVNPTAAGAQSTWLPQTGSEEPIWSWISVALREVFSSWLGVALSAWNLLISVGRPAGRRPPPRAPPVAMTTGSARADGSAAVTSPPREVGQKQFL